jgi:hypothetical protein
MGNMQIRAAVVKNLLEITSKTYAFVIRISIMTTLAITSEPPRRGNKESAVDTFEPQTDKVIPNIDPVMNREKKFASDHLYLWPISS